VREARKREFASPPFMEDAQLATLLHRAMD
jgi:hypothetical protein